MGKRKVGEYSMPRLISVRDFRQQMKEILGNEEVIVTKDGVPVARVIPLGPVERFEMFLEKVRENFQEAGLDDAEIQAMYRKARGKES
jgi:prevent-host-death family protein